MQVWDFALEAADVTALDALDEGHHFCWDATGVLWREEEEEKERGKKKEGKEGLGDGGYCEPSPRPASHGELQFRLRKVAWFRYFDIIMRDKTL